MRTDAATPMEAGGRMAIGAARCGSCKNAIVLAGNSIAGRGRRFATSDGGARYRASMAGARARGWPSTAIAGFSLIEVMMVVVIVGILASIAYPSYVEYIVRSRRATAAACLHDHAQFMERFNALNLRYDRDAAGAEVALPALTCAGDLNSGQTHYSFTLTDIAAATYTVNAAPQGHQASKDTECGTLSLNQAGVRSHSGSGSDRDCWR